MSGANRMGAAEFTRGTWLVTLRELAAVFDSGVAYVYTIAFALLANSIFMNEFFLTGNVDMTPWFELLPLLLAFFLPAISMRLWAEERKSRTVELLFTLPLRPMQAILGKYFAAIGMFELFLATSLPIPIMLAVLGSPDWGLVVSGYIGLGLLGALFLAIGCLLSALSQDQIVAFVTTTLVAFLLVLSGNDGVVAVLDGLAPGLALGSFLYEWISVVPHYDAFVGGVIELASLVYFASLSALALYGCGLVLERNRA
jgi:ABC-type transport system involved in multi-copper enzyme maturation permease subunit